MPLVFLPDRQVFFLWGEGSPPAALAELCEQGSSDEAELVIPPGKRAVTAGVRVPLLPALASLAALPASSYESLPGSVAVWSLASKLVLDLIAREKVVPAFARDQGRAEARWAVALASAEDAARVAALARSMPPAAHSVSLGNASNEVWAPEALLVAFLDAAVDAFVRTQDGAPRDEGRTSRRVRGNLEPVSPPAGRRPQTRPGFQPWEQRWLEALGSSAQHFAPEGFLERSVADDLQRWSEPAIGARDKLRACFRLELPPDEHRSRLRSPPFVLRFLLQSPDDPSLLVSAEEVWQTKKRGLEKLGRAFRDPQESLLEALGLAARLFAPVQQSLLEPMPDRVEMDAAAAWDFLDRGAALLAQAGFGVMVPGELTVGGRRRLGLRMRIGSKSRVAGAVPGAAGLSLDELLHVEWEAAVGGEPLSARDLAALAKQKAPLVRYRGAWVAVDPAELIEIQKRIRRGPSAVAVREALLAALFGQTDVAGLSAAVVPQGAFRDAVERLRSADAAPCEPPASLRGALRPYQTRGFAWLVTMAGLRLGACLADDMGLGKTVQLLAFLLYRADSAKDDARPALLVAPTSVVGNWEREAARFSPSLTVFRHYGTERAKAVKHVPCRSDVLVVTTYGLLRRDAELLAEVDWGAVVLDEAQNIKNAASRTARAARSLRATHRFALTGTPVENRLAELWSILEFNNPGLLGPLETFRREYAVPIERYGNEEAAERLKRIVGPFVLRRVKSDPAIISDLPPKNEMRVVCTLTREQATLYKAVVDEEMRRIESSEGVERRGRVLALILFLKQICNHPAQYLGESGPLPRRSGKLARLTEMLEEAIAEGDKSLVFTQFREMGDRLLSHLSLALGTEVLFLHGGTPRRARDEMVRRFQEEPAGPRIFALSVKAGGTGLNLTAASHVFHYDRWWNPAVEDQATDRAHRIGQTRSVQVHKLLCAGTVEEKIDRLLERKRDIAAKIVGAGERWITELGNDELRELLSLSKDTSVGDEPDDESPRSPSTAPRKRRRGAARRKFGQGLAERERGTNGSVTRH